METFKTPSEYSVDFDRGFQEFSMANLETGSTFTKFTRILEIETILFTRNYRTDFFYCRISVKIANIFPKKELLKYCTFCKHSRLFV